MTVQIVSDDAGFAETIGGLIRAWGREVRLAGHLDPPAGEVEIVLLDIRQGAEQALSSLAFIRARQPETEVILINRPDNIGPSIAGMQAGAADELIVPFDTGSLKGKIAEADRRRKKSRDKRSFLRRFGDAMAAATFAQAGEFDTAMDLLERPDEAKGRESKKEG